MAIVTIAISEVETGHPVTWAYNNSEDRHVVQYGNHVATFDGRDYGHIKAGEEFGQCVAHSLACCGMVTPGDAQPHIVKTTKRYNLIEYRRGYAVVGWNIADKESPIPHGWYASKTYIEDMKGVKFP